MLIIRDKLAGEDIQIRYVENPTDARHAFNFATKYKTLALDTESTGLNCYVPDWQLRMFQFGNAHVSYVIPARFRRVQKAILRLDITWIGHNGPHDIRCMDQHLGFETGVVCAGETYIPMHHDDPRNQKEGGVGHGLKEQAIAYVDPSAGKWEVALKAEFKKILIPIPGEFFKSGPRKGKPKTRVCTYGEGWARIDPKNRAYIAYAGADPILTYRRWKQLVPIVQQFDKLYEHDHKVELACDQLQRRGIRLDTNYAERYSRALESKARKTLARAQALGCQNIYSGPQVAKALTALGARFTERTEKGAIKTDDRVMKQQLKHGNPEVQELVHAILTTKRLTKRRQVYADGLLNQLDSAGRVHPSINSLAARTGRMSAGIFQQLPTKEED